MPKHKLFLVAGATIALASACGSSHQNNTPVTELGNAGFNASITALNNAFAGIGGMLPTPPAFSVASPLSALAFHDPVIASSTAFGSVWTNPNLSHPQCSGGGSDPHCGGSGVALRDWMTYQTDADAVRDNGSAINVFGRIKANLSQVCAIMNLAPNLDANGNPVDGVQSVTFTQAMNDILVKSCNFAQADIPANGTQVGFTASTPNDTSVYDKIIAIDDGAGSVQTYYIRSNTSTVNIQSIEVNTSPDRYSRSVMSLNRSTGAVRAEYVTAPKTASSGDAIEFQRVFFDPSANDAALLSYTRDFLGSPNRVAFAMHGRPSTTTAQMALSFRAQGFGGYSWGTVNGGCITQNTGAIATDGTVTCTGVTGVEMDGAPAGILSDLDTNVYTGSNAGTKLNNLSATTLLPFTSASTLFSTNVSHN